MDLHHNTDQQKRKQKSTTRTCTGSYGATSTSLPDVIVQCCSQCSVFKESYPVHVLSPAAVIVLSITVVVLQLMIQLVAPTLSTANRLQSINQSIKILCHLHKSNQPGEAYETGYLST